MTDQDWTTLLAALAAPDPGQGGFAVAEAITKRDVGTILFTVTAVDNADGEVRRIYSGNEAAYPVSGRKPKGAGPWHERVIEQRLPFVANTIEEVAAVFPDWPLIQSLGCGSALNIPVEVAGAVLGTVNLLDAPGHYTLDRVAAALALRPLYACCFLAAFAAEAHPLLTGSRG